MSESCRECWGLWWTLGLPSWWFPYPPLYRFRWPLQVLLPLRFGLWVPRSVQMGAMLAQCPRPRPRREATDALIGHVFDAGAAEPLRDMRGTIRAGRVVSRHCRVG